MIERLRYIFPLFAVLLVSCAKDEIDLSKDDIDERYEKAMELLEKRKYYRAQEHFQYVLLRGRHTEIGDDAQFYLGEAYFHNEEYESAISEYDKLVRQMTFSPHVRLARYRICQSYEKSSPKFYFDQGATDRAIQKYQEFIEDFPDSEYRDDATVTIREMRNKLSQKMYESAILYVKMEEYDAAVNYLEGLLELYFDTDFADKARFLIVDTLIVAGKFKESETFLKDNTGRFIDQTLLEDAKKLIDKHRQEEGKKL